MPGLARRLRTVTATVGAETRELAFYEGRAPLSDARLLVLAAPNLPARAEAAAILAGATRVLAADKLIAPEVAIGWGESSAAALSATSAAARLFVLADGPHRRAARSRRGGRSWARCCSATTRPRTRWSRSAAWAPTPSSRPAPAPRAATESDPGLASRPSDEPFISVRFGCDDPPNDPATDPALPAPFSAGKLSQKAECRRALARRCSLAVGPRTLLLTTGPLGRDAGTDAILAAIERLAPFDLVTVIVPRGEPEAIERARLLALRQPGRVALLSGQPSPRDERFARGAADAILLGDDHDRIGRVGRPGPALRDAPDRPRRRREPRLSGRLRPGLAHRPGDPLQRRHAVRDRERRPARAHPARRRRHLGAAREVTDGRRAALVGHRRHAGRDRRRNDRLGPVASRCDAGRPGRRQAARGGEGG